MKVRELMTEEVATVTLATTLNEVASKMKQEDTGAIPVLDEDRLVGIVTDRDIVIRCIAEGKDPGSARVNEVMTKSVRKVNEDATVKEVLTMMSSSEIRRVPVVNDRDEIVGIVSIGDIATQANQEGRIGQAIGDISQAPPNN